MANYPPTISSVMRHFVPFQDGLMRYLNRSDLIAMSEASIPVPITIATQRKNLLRVRCEQRDDNPPHRRCRISSLNIIRMRDCEGAWYNEGEGYDPSPTRDAFGYWGPLVQGDHTPGFEICENCRITYYNAFAQLEMHDIEHRFWTPMCKRHSLEYFEKRPILNYCRCFELLDGKWLCNACRVETFGTLETRMVVWKDELLKTRCKRGRRGRVCVDRKRERERPACPIPRCGGKPWMNTRAVEGMDMCLACCGVQPFSTYEEAEEMEE